MTVATKNPNPSKLDTLDMKAIRAAYDRGLSDGEIAAEIKASTSLVVAPITIGRWRRQHDLPAHYGAGGKPLTDAARARATPSVDKVVREIKKARKPRVVDTEPSREEDDAVTVKEKKPKGRKKAARREIVHEEGLDIPQDQLEALARRPVLLKALCVQVALLADDPLPFILAARALKPILKEVEWE